MGEGVFVQHNEPARHKSLIVESDPIQSNPTQPFNARDDFRARVSIIERVALHYRLRDPPREQIDHRCAVHACTQIPGYPIAEPGPSPDAMHAPAACGRVCAYSSSWQIQLWHTQVEASREKCKANPAQSQWARKTPSNASMYDLTRPTQTKPNQPATFQGLRQKPIERQIMMEGTDKARQGRAMCGCIEQALTLRAAHSLQPNPTQPLHKKGRARA